MQYSEALDPRSSGADIVPLIGVSGAGIDGHQTMRHPQRYPSPTGTLVWFDGSGAKDLAGNVSVDAGVFEFLYAVPVYRNRAMWSSTRSWRIPHRWSDFRTQSSLRYTIARANKTFDLSGWTIADGSTIGQQLPSVVPRRNRMPSSRVPGTFPSSTSFGAVAGCAELPSLNNDGDPLTLKSDAGTAIDAVTYDLGWYHDAVKALGGWTIERIDPTTVQRRGQLARFHRRSGGTGHRTVCSAMRHRQYSADADRCVCEQRHATGTAVQRNDGCRRIAGGSYVISPNIPVDLAVASAATARCSRSEPPSRRASSTITVTSVSDCPGNTIGVQNSLAFALPERWTPAMW